MLSKTKKEMQAPTAKAYRAILPGSLRDEDITRLEQWADANCSLSRVMRAGNKVALVCISERDRGTQCWARKIKRILNGCGIGTAELGSSWLTLITEESAFAQLSRGEAGSRHLRETPEGDADDDVRVVTLRRAGYRKQRSRINVVREPLVSECANCC